MHIINWWSTNPLRAWRHYKSTLPDSPNWSIFTCFLRSQDQESTGCILYRSCPLLASQNDFQHEADQTRFWKRNGPSSSTTASSAESPHERETNHLLSLDSERAPHEILNMRLLECLEQIDHSSQQEIFTRTAVAWTTFFPIHATQHGC